MVQEDLDDFPDYAFACVNAAHYAPDQNTLKEMLLKAATLAPNLATPDVVHCARQPCSLSQSQVV